MADEKEPGESWWAALDALQHSVEKKFEEGDVRMTQLQAGVDENTRVTRETKEATDEIRETTGEIKEFLTTMKSLLKLGNMLSAITIKIWKPIGYVAGAALSLVLLWQTLKGGK